MIFTEENVAKILAGTKTQTRRVVKFTKPWGYAVSTTGDGQPWLINAWREVDCSYRVGHTYAVQPGRGKAAVARIAITAIRYCERAGDISDDDARAEGFPDADAFRAVYGRLNGAAALERPCWCLTFGLAGDAGASGAGGDGR